jgi:hypothetical protein
MITARIFGLFPLSGLLLDDPNNVKFKWVSLRTAFSLSFICCAIFACASFLVHQYQQGPLTPGALGEMGLQFGATSSLSLVVVFLVKIQT